MRKLLILCFALVISGFAIADKWVQIGAQSPKEVQVKLLSSDINSSEFNLSLEGYNLKEVRVNGEVQYIVEVEGATRILEAGAPDLPKVAASFAIPDMDAMQIEVVNSEYSDYSDIVIAPSKGNLYRNVDPNTLPYEFGAAYETDAFYPGNLTDSRTPYIINSVRGQTVLVNPFQYNPVTKTLRVYHNITVRVSSAGTVGENVLEQSQSRKINQTFQNIFEYQFLNANVLQDRYDPLGELGNMLIIAYPDFMDAMNPYVEWKTQKGFNVEMVSVAEVGSSSSAIATYVENYFNENGLTFLLLVGDAAQVPSSYSSGDSDNNYTYVVGNDHYPDFISGRFSAESVAHVETMVARTLDYEKTPYVEETGWYGEAMSIGSSQGPGDDDFDQGVSVVNYTGHGSDESWVTSGFNISNVNNLQNTGKYPFIWSVACVNGNFVPGTCFGEAWTRATDVNGNPAGCIGAMMSTINQSWAPPMEGQDAFNHILCELEEGVLNRTFGGISFNGMLRMNDTYGSQGDEMTDTWTLFGDPSAIVRTAAPQQIEASHDPTLFIGATELLVNVADFEGAVAALTMNGNLLSTGVISGGSTTLSFDGLEEVGEAKLVVTGFNGIPYIEDISVIVPEGPYLVYRAVEVNDASGNNNAVLDYNETANLSVELENVGVDAASDVTITLSTTSSYVTITDNTETLASLSAGESTVLSDGFAVTVADNVPDQEVLVFQLTIEAEDNTWESQFSLPVNAPQFAVNDMQLVELTGNMNGRFDPGESAELKISVSNVGHSSIADILTSLVSSSNFVTIENAEYTISELAVGASAEAVFTVNASATTPVGTSVTFDFGMESGAYNAMKQFGIAVGLIVEDWETGDLSGFEWTLSGNSDWFIQEGTTYEGVNALQSGVINDNQETLLTLNYEVSEAGTLSFYYKTSSEQNYDFLSFSIDGVQVQSWSGENDWALFETEVEPGEHTFTWKYNKDAYGASGSDCAWVDYIVLPPMVDHTPLANAGQDVSTCTLDPVTLEGYAMNYESYTWVITSGHGYFENQSGLTPTYVPAPEDLAAGQVTITLSVLGEGGEVVEDNVVITLYQAPEINAGESVTLCQGDLFTAEATATDYLALNWTTSGTGTFDDATALNPVYTPSADDIAAGEVTLSVVATSHEICEEAMSEVVLTINSAPEVFEFLMGDTVVDYMNVQQSAYTITTALNATSYDWMLSPEEAGTIEVDELEATVTWSETFEGNAVVKATAMNDCGEVSAEYGVRVYSTVGFDENNSLSASVYPNPTKGEIFITLDTESTETVDIRIVNALGVAAMVQEGVVLNGRNTAKMDLSDLAQGVYFMVIETGHTRTVQKIVVE